jgi:O-antigen ligase/tetratricopeptide (TPR) repeat protein
MPFLAFVFDSRMIYPWVTARNFIFRCAVELLFGAYILLAISAPKYRPYASSLLIVTSLLTVWAGIAVFASEDPVRSFWSTFERMGGYVTLLHLFAYFIIVISIFDSLGAWQRLFEISVIASAMVGIYVSFEVMEANWFSAYPVSGTFGNPVYLGAYMLFNIFFVLLLALLPAQRSSKNVNIRGVIVVYVSCIVAWAIFIGLAYLFPSIARVLPIAGMILIGFAGLIFARLRDQTCFAAFLVLALTLQIGSLTLAQTRGPILGVIVGLGVALFYLWRTARRTQRWLELRRIAPWFFAVFVSFVLFCSAAFWISNVPALIRIASVVSLADSTIMARLFVWQIVWEGFLARPFSGWGPENFDVVFHRFYNPAMFAYETWFDNPHNLFLEWLIAGGLPALSLLVALFVLIGVAFARTDHLSRPGRAVMLGLVTAYAFHSLFVSSDLHASIYFFTLAGLATVLSKRISQERHAVILSHRTLALAISMFVGLAFAGLYAINAPGMANAFGLLRAIMLSDPHTGAAKPLSANLAEFSSVLNGAPLGRQEATEQLLEFTFLLASRSDSPVDQPTLLAFYDESNEAMVRMLRQRPQDARLELLFGVFLNRFGQTEEAAQHLSRALQLAPKKQSILFELGINTYLRAGYNASGLSVLQRAFELEPRNSEGRISLAMALYLSGKNAEADRILTVDIRGMSGEAKTKALLHYRRALETFKVRLGRINDAHTRLALARFLYRIEDGLEAIAELQQATKLDPSIYDEAIRLINQYHK